MQSALHSPSNTPILCITNPFEYHVIFPKFLNISFESHNVNKVENHTVGCVTYSHKLQGYKINATSFIF